MKNLLSSTLLIITCISTFQVSGQNRIDFRESSPGEIDSVSISKPQVKNIYIGLKQSEQFRDYYYECLQVSNELNQLINTQDQELQKSLKTITDLNCQTEELNEKITSTAVEIQRLKSKKIPWYLHPITYAITGFIGGIYLMK